MIIDIVFGHVADMYFADQKLFLLAQSKMENKATNNL